MNQRVNAFVVLILLVPCNSAAAEAPNVADFPMKNGVVAFAIPSMNIECAFVPAETAVDEQPGPELICNQGRHPNIFRVVIGPAGPAKLRALLIPSEKPSSSAQNVLLDGEVWHGGPFSCEAASTGLTCAHEDGRGLSMSKTRISAH